MTLFRQFIYYFNLFCMGYTLLLSVIYLIQLIISYMRIIRDNKRRPAADYDKYVDSENLMPISVLVPAHNEQENVVDNIRNLLKIDYPEYELIVVNDGSTDKTHDVIVEAFQLYPIEYAMKVSIPAQEIRGVYYNSEYPQLIYIDKEQGGKSDALNAGINASVYPLFVCLDADSRLEKDAILRLSTEFIKDSRTVVAGGMIRIANGSTIEDGQFQSFRLPEKAVERFQIVEYFRSFLAGRVSWDISNSMLIVSGAFGVFNKQTVIECGGYKNNTVGEDMEIVVNIHHTLRKNRKKYSVKFRQDAVCWTQGPLSMGDIHVQRRRWQVGLMDSLFRHIGMLFNPRYGFVGLLSIPYSWLFEFLGAVIEVLGYIIIPLSVILQELSWFYFILYFLLSTGLGIVISLGGLILEQKVNKGVFSSKQCIQLTRYALLENFGYRQYITLCRFDGVLRYNRFKGSWGRIRRKEFNK